MDSCSCPICCPVSEAAQAAQNHYHLLVRQCYLYVFAHLRPEPWLPWRHMAIPELGRIGRPHAAARHDRHHGFLSPTTWSCRPTRPTATCQQVRRHENPEVGRPSPLELRRGSQLPDTGRNTSAHPGPGGAAAARLQHKSAPGAPPTPWAGGGDRCARTEHALGNNRHLVPLHAAGVAARPRLGPAAARPCSP